MSASDQHPTVLVTGATSWLGAAIATEMHDAGAHVRAGYRTRSRLRRALGGFDVEPVRVDVLDRRSLRRALRGCHSLFHVAAIHSYRPRPEVWDINARGPAMVVEEAAAAGVSRVVMTSSAAALGPSPDGQITDERQIYRAGELGLAFHNARHEGESRALAAAARHGIELVTVCPTYVLGAPDVNALDLSASTRIVVNYLRGRLPAVVDSWTNVVDIADAARGHVLAWAEGRPGHRYILGGANVRWPDLLRGLGRVAGVQHPFVVIPQGVAGHARPLRAALGRQSPVSLAVIALMAQDYRFTSARAERELGYVSRDLDQTLRRSVRWFMEELEAGRFGGFDTAGLRTLTGVVAAAERGRLLPAARWIAGRLAAEEGQPSPEA